MKQQQIKFYRYPHPHNVGDTLTPYILKNFLPDREFVSVNREESGKLIAVGSIMHVIKAGDTIWGSGVIRGTEKFPQAKDCKFLAVRGKLSRDILVRDGGTVPEIYGDPAILLPLMFEPHVKKTSCVGIIPHFVDTPLLTKALGNKLAGTTNWKYIDVFADYETFIKEVLSCSRIISSSLHGLIIAEAYGKEVEWMVLSDKVIGDGFKFKDYLTGTDRPVQEAGKFPKLQRRVLLRQQADLLRALQQI